MSADRVKLHYLLGSTSGLVGGAVDVTELIGAANDCFGCVVQEFNAVAHGQYGDPIDTTYGTFNLPRMDLSTEGRGAPLAAMRTYSSASAGTNGPFGYGWNSSSNAHLDIDPVTGDVTVVQESGSEVTFVHDSGTYTPSAPRFMVTLVENTDGTFTLVRNGIETLTFDSAGLLTTHADRNGTATTYSYVSGMLDRATNAEGRWIEFDWTGSLVTRVHDSASREVLYSYNNDGELETVTYADGAVETYTYDDGHRLLTLLDPNQQTSSAPEPITNTYDGQGRVISQVDQLDRETTFEYNTDWTVVITDPAGNKTLDKYTNGLRTQVIYGFGTSAATAWHFAYDPITTGLVASIADGPGDANDHSTSATYDDKARILTSSDGLGRTSTFTYDNFGNVLTATTPNPSGVGPANVTVTNTYDVFGNLASTTRPLYSGTSTYTDQTVMYERDEPGKPDLVTEIIDPLNKTTVMTYDGLGQLDSISSPDGRQTVYTHDSLGRVSATVAPRGNESGATPADFTTVYTYDELGRVLSTSTANDSAPVVTGNEYDDNGNLIASTDGDGRETTYAYDLANQQVSVNRPDTSVLSTTYNDDGTVHQQIDGANEATTYAYDPLARAVTVTDPANRTTSFTYDATNAVLTVANPDNQITSNTYDNSGALLSTTYSDPTTPDVTRSYNAAGVMTAMIDGSGNQTWEHDSLGRLVSHTNGVGDAVEYGYSIRNELTSIDYPDHGEVTRSFDDDGLIASVEDWLANETGFTYDANGQLTNIDYPNGVSGTTAYDDAGRSTSITYGDGSSTLASFDYSRSVVGDITAETLTGAGTNKTYTYNDLGQLATENAGAFGYDNADNLSTMSDGTTMTYDNANQVQSRTKDSVVTTYGFDSRGNRTSQTTGSVTTTFGYDQANRLTSYGSDTVYEYDGGGLRTSKTVGATASDFTYNTAEGLPLVIDDGTNAYVHGPGGIVISQINGSTVEYLHQDHLGSTRLLTDDGGDNVGQYQFDAYGNATHFGTTTTPVQFAGQYFDTESGLTWMRARYYDPSTGQFMSRDPMVSVTRSAYLYTDGDPTNTTDVSGLLCVTFFDKNCESFAAKNPKASMAVSNFGGGVLNGMTLGNADWLLPKGAEGNYSRNSNFHTAGEVAALAIPGFGAIKGAGVAGICVKLFRYENAGGAGLALLRNGDNVVRADVHRVKIRQSFRAIPKSWIGSQEFLPHIHFGSSKRHWPFQSVNGKQN